MATKPVTKKPQKPVVRAAKGGTAKPKPAVSRRVSRKKAASLQPGPRENMTVILEQHLEMSKMGIDVAAEKIGLSVSYLRSLLSGKSPWSKVDPQYYRPIAAMLGMSTTEALSLGGVLRTDDFMPPDRSAEAELNRVWSAMSLDRVVSHLLPTKREWFDAPRPMQTFAVNLYRLLEHQETVRMFSAPPPADENPVLVAARAAAAADQKTDSGKRPERGMRAKGGDSPSSSVEAPRAK